MNTRPPSAIAAAHGVSVRTINRAFNATGDTVSETVRIRRLARARGELTEPGTSIGAIATKWGFSDGSHFSRTFQSRYGTTPKEFRAAHGAANVVSPRMSSDVADVQKNGPRVMGHGRALLEPGVTPTRS